MSESLPALFCVALIGVFFVFPAWLYIAVTERRNRLEREKSVEAGRHEPVTIQPYVDLSLCMGAGACVTACPEGVLKLIDGQAVAVNMSACIGHGVCVPVCPVDAIELVFGSDQRGIDIPQVDKSFESNVEGLYIAGELGGMGLIAAAAEQGVRAMQAAAEGLQKAAGRRDVIIVGAGPAGLAAALVAKQKGLDYLLVDQGEVGGVVRHYPRKKLVFTRPMVLPLFGKVNLKQLYKEELVKLFEDIVAKCGLQVSTNERVDSVSKLPDGGFEVKTATRTVEGQRVILALGRGGTPRKLDVPGEDQEKVSYTLLEPEHFQNEHIVVVGGGDSAVEAAMQLGEQPGNKVLLSYRGSKINRPKEKNIKRLKDAVKKGQVELLLESVVKEVGVDRIVLDRQGESMVMPNDHVFVFAGGVLPTKFLERAGINVRRHFGKRVEEGGRAPADKQAPSAPKPSAEGPVTTLPPGGNSLPTSILATSILPTPLQGRASDDDPDITAPRPPPGETTEPRPGPAGVPSDEATVPRVSPLELAALRDDTNPPGSPRLGDLATSVLPGREVRPPPEPSPESYDETPMVRPDAGRSREGTEINALRRVATLGADRKPEPEPEPAPSPAPTPSGVGRVVAAPAPRPPAPAEGGPTGLSRGISRAGRGPGATPRAPVPAGAIGEVRPEGRKIDAPSGKVRPPVPTPASPATGSAVEPFLQAAESQLAAGRFGEVLQMTSDLSGLVERAASALSAPDRRLAKRRVLELEGRAHLGLGDWESALPPLEEAVALARDDGGAVLGRALQELGRARHHAEHFDQARTALTEALAAGLEGEHRASGLRLLGDLALRDASLDEAHRCFEEARTAAVDGPGQARALRGLAHLAAIRGEFLDSLKLLDRAGQLLGPDGPAEVHAGIEARAIELEISMGAYGRAYQRALELVDRTTRRRIVDQQAEAVSLLAEVLALLGLSVEAAEAAGQVDGLARHLGQRGTESRLRAARAACEAGRHDVALRLLNGVGTQSDGVVDGLEAQHLAVMARALSRTQPAESRDLANRALARPAPRLIIRAARIRLDAALALLDAGSPSTARGAIKQGLKDVQGSGTRGLKLELLVAMYLAEPDRRVVEAVARSALKMLEELPEHCARPFRARGVIAIALERWGDAEG